MSEEQPRKETDAGQQQAAFPRTRWSVILDVQDDDPAALAAFCRAYWFPLYSFARRRNLSVSDAEDLTQSFFERLLSRELVLHARRERGTLRSFLLRAFTNFATEEWRKAGAQKRGGGNIELIDLAEALPNPNLDPLDARLLSEIDADAEVHQGGGLARLTPQAWMSKWQEFRGKDPNFPDHQLNLPAKVRAFITIPSDANYRAFSFLTAAGNGPATIAYAITLADFSTQKGTFVSPDWFDGTNVAYTAHGRVRATTGAADSVGTANPRLYSVDVTLTNMSSVKFISLEFQSGRENGHAAIFAISAALGLPSLSFSTNSITVLAGEDVALRANANGGPPLSFRWDFIANGAVTPLVNGALVSGADTSELRLARVSTAQAGTYRLEVSNPFAVLNRAVELKVLPRSPMLTIVRGPGAGFTITSTQPGTLESTTLLDGPSTSWTPDGSINAVRSVTPTGNTQFYRISVP